MGTHEDGNDPGGVTTAVPLLQSFPDTNIIDIYAATVTSSRSTGKHFRSCEAGRREEARREEEVSFNF